MIEKLLDDSAWAEFLEYKLSHELLCKKEKELLSDYIENRKYRTIAEKIVNGGFEFSIPARKEINKMGTAKKRVVYSFGEEENFILKFIAYLLYAYDNKLPDNCYAFRRDIGAKKAFTDMRGIRGVSGLCCFKTDISNYFNSIDVDILSDILTGVIDDDERLLRLLLSILRDERAIWQGEIITERKGAMAGTPVSPFLANIYLSEMDRYFLERGVHYARYSDDIIVFDSGERIKEHADRIHGFFKKYRLGYNPEKEAFAKAGEEWTFLGFSYKNGETDIAPASVGKLMGKIRRQARSLRRWKLKNNAPDDKTLAVFNRKFNRKFYSSETGRELCWARWYFPLITTDKSLRAIDEYMQQYQRYLITGRHSKSNYAAVPYSMMKDCGYRPLTAEYYKEK